MSAAPASRPPSEDRSRYETDLAGSEALEGELLPPANRVTRQLMSSSDELALGEQIRAEHEAEWRLLKAAVKHFRKCGVALLRARAALGHGGFTHLLKSTVKLHPRMAQRYMMLARELAKLPAARCDTCVAIEPARRHRRAVQNIGPRGQAAAGWRLPLPSRMPAASR